ncbi:MAG TPA: VOC family protein [Candidatus Thermoplasmatota archaeon]|jgi:catechol 2,3-dioxygenase-like lactoylglutathione lyase family enzyme|nr:VOC family protein [Candidatus Thermoplasmatota archaeon]
MSAAARVREVTFTKAIPLLPTKSLERTKEWYERHLGFEAAEGWKEGNFLILRRDGQTLFFSPTDHPQAAEAGTMYLHVAGDIDALAARLKADGLDLHDAPEDKPYGMREFTVHDADGRHVLIGKPLEARP